MKKKTPATPVEKAEEVPVEEVEEAPAELAAEVEEAPAEPAAEVEVSPPEEVETLRQQLEEEKVKAAENYDQWLRSVAELRNYKKRVEQEREQWAREASVGLVARLLPVLDDFERAIAVLPDEKLARFSWVEGILLIYRRLQSVLEQHGLQHIEVIGKPFDPYVHEAVLFEEVPTEKDQLVLSELQKGYKLYDRVLRPALVKVGKAAAEPVPPTEGKEPAEPVPPTEGKEPGEPEAPAPTATG